jgi:hypothetical protein
VAPDIAGIMSDGKARPVPTSVTIIAGRMSIALAPSTGGQTEEAVRFDLDRRAPR